MRLTRFVWFFISILIGLAAGLFYGWFINPVKYVDTVPAVLRLDYKADYVLMTAEIFAKDKDIPAAVRRLSALSDQKPARVIQEAILKGGELGYNSRDIELMGRLSEAVLTWVPSEEGAP